MSSEHSSSTRVGHQDAAIPQSDLERRKAEQDNDATLSPLHSVQSPAQSHIQKPQSVLGECIFVSVVCCAQLMAQAGIGMTLGPLHIIGKSFGIADSPGQLSWFMAAYSLTVGTFILPAGRLGDLFGHKKLFICGFLWYGLWTLLAGFSVYVNTRFFDICRAMQGIGPAFLLPNALAILGRTYEPGRKKEMIFSLLGATAPTGATLGAVFASLIAQDLWWPWAFWIMAIACFIFGLLGIVVIPPTPSPVFPPDDGISIWERIDTWGTITGVSGLVLFNFAWNQGPVAGWPEVYVYVLLIIGVLAIALFFHIESRAKFPLIPFEVLNKNTGFVLGCICAGWSSFSIWIFYLFQFLEILRRESALMASTHLVPTTISGLAAAMTTGFLLSRVPASFIMMAAMIAFTTGSIVLATMPLHQTYWAQAFVCIIIMPWGMDMSFPAGTILLSNAMPKEHQGIAASLVNTVVNYSISIALGIAGTIDSQLHEGGGNVLRGYRGAFYFGVGMAGAGLVLAGFFVLHELRERKRVGGGGGGGDGDGDEGGGGRREKDERAVDGEFVLV